MTDETLQIKSGIAYANRDGIDLLGDLYLPRNTKAAPALVAVHGGAWIGGARTAFQHWGRHLAARGIALFAISYRLATNGKAFPQAVDDVLAGVRFLRGNASEFNVDPRRIGLLGASAGGHLAALAALGSNSQKFSGSYPQDAHASVECGVRVLIGVYGIYDALAMWTRYLVEGPRDNNIEKFLGASPMEDRQLYFDASPISYATFANNKVSVFLVTGTQDDVADRAAHTDAFLRALKQANFFVRTCIVPGAPHFWMNDPIDEPTSYSGFLAPRLMRFLAEKL